MIGAGLLVASFTRVMRVDPGFATERVLTTRISLPTDRYQTSESQREFWTRVLEKARADAWRDIRRSRVEPAVRRSAQRRHLHHRRSPAGAGPTEPPHAGQDLAVGDYFQGHADSPPRRTILQR